MRSVRLTEICHGTPFDEDAYVFDEMDAVYALRAATRPLCLFGHTHAPFGARLRADELEFVDAVAGRASSPWQEGMRLIVNVGVGGPAAGRRSARRLRRPGRRGPHGHLLSGRLPRRAGPGPDPRGRPARGAGPAARPRALTRPAGDQAGGAGVLAALAAARAAASSRRRSSAANASLAARDPRIQPMTIPSRIVAGM